MSSTLIDVGAKNVTIRCYRMSTEKKDAFHCGKRVVNLEEYIYSFTEINPVTGETENRRLIDGKSLHIIVEE